MTLRIAFILLFFAAGVLRAEEHIIISGGPALRFYEKHKVATHDRYWGNFIDSASAKIRKIKPKLSKDDTIGWLVFRPGYVTRGREENENFIETIENRARELGVNLTWFDTRKELLDYLNDDRDDDNLIARLEYFGHSNKRNWMFDYSNRLDGAAAEPCTLHVSHLRKIYRDIFTEEPFLKSWGCHSGEEYSKAWHKYTGKRMIGAIGKTDYSNGGIPVLSTEGGEWTE